MLRPEPLEVTRLRSGEAAQVTDPAGGTDLTALVMNRVPARRNTAGAASRQSSDRDR